MNNLKIFWKISRNVWKSQKRTSLLARCSPVFSSKLGQKNTALYKHMFLKNAVTYGHSQILQRCYSDDQKGTKFQLMDFGVIVWPNIIKTIKNWIFTNFIIRPYMDPDFTLAKFMEGSRVATEIVSRRLAEGNLAELDGLVTAECLEEVKKNMAVLNAKQRHEISICKEDIYFSFPYELGIIFDDESRVITSEEDLQKQKRFVEITVVHHVLRGHKEMMERGEPVPLNIGARPEYRDKVFVLNYRFIRNYTKGVSDQWTINVVNHFKPTEFL